MARQIILTQGQVALVDEEDFGRFGGLKWRAAKAINSKGVLMGYYACRSEIVSGVARCVLMHRAILEAPDGQWVDHANGDRLDCRRQNLRLCTPSENSRNSRTAIGSSGYRGVGWDPKQRRWVARIWVNYKATRIGGFHDPVQAAMARDQAALRLHGDFAVLNFPNAHHRGA